MSKRRTLAGAVAISIAVAALARGVTRRFAITEESMTPALRPGDWVLARKRTGASQRGDIVVFDDPSGSGMSFVKRVVGLPGEDVATSNGHVTIDGSILAEHWAVGATSPDGTWTVPQGHVWVLGDNRGQSSSDGRTIGPVSLDAIGWKIVATYWPVQRMALHS